MEHPVTRRFSLFALPLLIMLYGCAQPPAANLPQLSESDAAWIGERIFANECNLKIPCLTSWNAGEDFPSLGIGHFIWYRENQREAFVESFPPLLDFYQQRGVDLPAWISALPNRDSPWQRREDFLAEQDSARMQELRSFLNNTRHIQVEFIIRRMQASLPTLVAAADRPQEVEKLFHAVAASSSPLGMYALIDYINFKGDGTSPSERYQGEGWGLLQVLEHMLETPEDAPLMARFAESARHVLARRIANSPPDRGEERWRVGWNNRIATYESLGGAGLARETIEPARINQ